MGRSNSLGAARIADVAAAAGVSRATVSRVMNDRFMGEPSVSAHVRAVAEELGYSPSPLARSLASGKTGIVGFVVPDLGNPAFQDVLSHLTKASTKDGYRVLIADSGESVEEEAILAVETRRRCDCLVLCGPRMPAAALTGLVDSLQPLVLINRPGVSPSTPSLSVDFRRAIALLVEHLWSLGHRRMLYLEGPESSVSNVDRLLGIQDVVTARGDIEITHLPCGSSSADGHAAAEAVISSGCSAVLAFNDLVAVGLLTGLTERGVKVPEDLSVTGFDDIPLARYITPPLTTVRVPWGELGTEAWDRLRGLIANEPAPVASTVRSQLIARGSSGPFTPRWARGTVYTPQV